MDLPNLPRQFRPGRELAAEVGQLTVEDAIDHGMWGWTPHNYVQPQFANWQDVQWHRRLNDRFLQS